MRSKKYGIHPMPPSERATRTSGNRRNTEDQIRSVAACTMLSGVNVIRQSMGASGDVTTICEDEPMCMHATTPSSLQALQNGSQWSECRLGQPSFDGFSEKVTAWAPFAAVRRTSAARTSGSQIAGRESGMERPGGGSRHSSICQSLYA